MEPTHQDPIGHYLENSLENSLGREHELPSNFSWRVMQRIMLAKVLRARRRAIWEGRLVTLVTLVSATLLFFAYKLFTGVPALTLPTVSIVAIPAALTFALVFLVDTAVDAYRASHDSPSVY